MPCQKFCPLFTAGCWFPDCLYCTNVPSLFDCFWLRYLAASKAKPAWSLRMWGSLWERQYRQNCANLGSFFSTVFHQDLSRRDPICYHSTYSKKCIILLLLYKNITLAGYNSAVWLCTQFQGGILSESRSTDLDTNAVQSGNSWFLSS